MLCNGNRTVGINPDLPTMNAVTDLTKTSISGEWRGQKKWAEAYRGINVTSLQ